ncbi:antibiotic biosynthesis monooxygenase [Frondihabitans sp. PAMC 28766]|uniref:putative quinol monooxygenase n=1 Tax=Frondihabitans sp. PAMC 28766 TaxID=1795630 RepID=UPI00078E95DB|nr:putative quinol monooxygenase [Frondihabitans sp. PAMC 28766]AMM20150.1 antibiotic biosynthesis monooxygenase [Frondihabitans sp. PAMC 28766]
MPDLNVVAVITANPGGEEAVRDALHALVEPTRREAGCISYELFESEAKTGVFVTVELWRSHEALDQHTKSAHLQEAMTSAGSALASADIHPLSPVG